MRTLRLSRLAAAALFVTTLSGTAASAAIGGSAPAGAASLPACNLKALANHKRRRQHHLLGVGLDGQPAVAAGDHQRLQLVAVQGARHPGHPGGLRRHLAEVPGRPLQRAAARRRAARGPGHPGGHRHRLVPAGAVLHERRQVLHERLPAAAARLLEGERRAVGAPLRRLGADRVLQRERLHEGRPQPERPAGHAAPAARRRQGAEGLGQRHGASSSTPGTSRRGWPRPTSSSSTTTTAAAPGPRRRSSRPRPRCPSSAS